MCERESVDETDGELVWLSEALSVPDGCSVMEGVRDVVLDADGETVHESVLVPLNELETVAEAVSVSDAE